MRERASFERELDELLARETAQREYELRGDWQSEQAFQKAALSAPEQFETGAAIAVTAFRFPGVTNEVALVFSGVHRDEPQGLAVARALFDKLKDASSRGVKPRFTTILIPQLFATTRQNTAGEVLSSGKKLEPNRNFPAPGEGYEYVRLRASKRRDGAELLDCRGAAAAGDRVTHRILAENRILMQLIEREKPSRTVSIHSHSIPGTTGDGPGIFVDPRSGFNEHTDVSFTATGRSDDQLAFDMLGHAASLLTLPLKDDSNKELSHPLRGNLRAFSLAMPFPFTVHYTTTRHVCGTSFGMWAPAPEQSGVRPGVLTITAELPKYKATASQAAAEMVRVHTAVIAEKFLGLP